MSRTPSRFLVDAGATTLTDAATPGLLDRVKTYFPGATSEEVNVAFWAPAAAASNSARSTSSATA